MPPLCPNIVQAVHYPDERQQYYFSLYKYSRRFCGFVSFMRMTRLLNRALTLMGAFALLASTSSAQTTSNPAASTSASPSSSSMPSATPASSSSPAQGPNATTAAPAAKSRVEVPPGKVKPLRIPRLDKPPVIDGKLNDD